MKEQILSQSPLRDPFDQARKQHESKAQSKGTSLSNSPVSAPANPAVSDHADFEPSMKAHGINHEGLAMNDIGRVQLVGRLKEKFGEQFMQNEQVLKILSLFDKKANSDSKVKRMSFNESISNAERTLGALFGK